MQSKRRPVSIAEGKVAPPRLPTFATVRVGYLLPESSVGRLVVDFDGNAAGAVSARTTLVLDLRRSPRPRRPAGPSSSCLKRAMWADLEVLRALLQAGDPSGFHFAVNGLPRFVSLLNL